MITINLLPVKQIKRRLRARNEILGLLGGLVLLVVVLALVAGQQAGTIDGLQTRAKRLKKEIANNEATVKQIKKLEKERAALEQKLNTIKRLKADSQLPVRLLDAIARLVPTSRMWLTSLNLNQKGITLNGVAMDNPTVARFMKTISASPYFLGAELKSSSMQVVAGQKLKSFSLTIGVNHVMVAAADEAADKKGKKRN